MKQAEKPDRPWVLIRNKRFLGQIVYLTEGLPYENVILSETLSPELCDRFRYRASAQMVVDRINKTRPDYAKVANLDEIDQENTNEGEL